MMYLFMTLNNETEITHSEMKLMVELKFILKHQI